MQIHIAPNDGVPIYLQIVNQLKYLVAAGRLAAGEELPPIRVLAERLLVNPNTVARAYRELEAAGVVEKRRTAGTYVSAVGSPLAHRERLKILTERVDALVAEARQLGIDVDHVVELIRRRGAAPVLSGLRSALGRRVRRRAERTVRPRRGREDQGALAGAAGTSRVGRRAIVPTRAPGPGRTLDRARPRRAP